MNATEHDKRYTIRLEYCGQITAQYVLRFCGEWVSCHTNWYSARFARKIHNANRF